MRDIEINTLEKIRSLLLSFAERLSAHGLSWQGPDLQMWNADPDCYSTELRVEIMKRGEIHDVLEVHLFRNGEQTATINETEEWFRRELEQMVQGGSAPHDATKV